MFLTDDEVHDLTKRSRPSAQSRALKSMGIEHKIRPDGSIAVLRSHVERVMGEGATSGKPPRKTQPNLSLVS